MRTFWTYVQTPLGGNNRHIMKDSEGSRGKEQFVTRTLWAFVRTSMQTDNPCIIKDSEGSRGREQFGTRLSGRMSRPL